MDVVNYGDMVSQHQEVVPMSFETDLLEYNQAMKYIRKKLSYLPKSKRLNAVVVMKRADRHNPWDLHISTIEVYGADGRVIHNFIRSYIPFSCKVHLWGDQ